MGRFLFYSIVIACGFLGWRYAEISERVPILFTGITACFSYEAYRYNKEKFRLELFEKRWEVYSSMFSLLSKMPRHNKDVASGESVSDVRIKEIVEAAHGSFRGKGWQKSKFLFGSEVESVLKEIDAIYIQSSIGGLSKEQEREIYVLLIGLPEKFSPYLYFGDYKNEAVKYPQNLCELRVLCGEKIKKTKEFFTCSTLQNSSNLPVRKDSV